MENLKRKPKFKVGNILKLNIKGRLMSIGSIIEIIEIRGTYYKFTNFPDKIFIDIRGIEVIEDEFQATLDEVKTVLYGRGH